MIDGPLTFRGGRLFQLEDVMGWISKILFKSVEIGGDRQGSYDMSTGVIKHPPKGTKGPKVKGKTQNTKGKK